MRRNSIDKNYLAIVFISLALVLYQVITSLYTFLPVFAGLFFCYILIALNDEKQRVYVILAIIYLIIYDVNKGFYIFSYILFLFIFYNLFVAKVRDSLTCNSCILVIFIVSGYIGHYLTNSFVAYILNEDLPVFSNFYYLYYILIDSILAIIFFRDKI
jgi:hypothetical protein